MGTRHQPTRQAPGAPTEVTPSRIHLLPLLAPLTCPELVVGAALQHRATIVGTAGETPLSPPARGKVLGSGHCLLQFPPQLPGALITLFLLCQAWYLGFAQLFSEKGSWCTAVMSKCPRFMCKTAF